MKIGQKFNQLRVDKITETSYIFKCSCGGKLVIQKESLSNYTTLGMCSMCSMKALGLRRSNSTRALNSKERQMIDKHIAKHGVTKCADSYGEARLGHIETFRNLKQD